MAKGDTLLWLADTASLTQGWFEAGARWLNEAERLRHGRFVRAERRRQFVAGRVLLRMALGTLLDVPARAIALSERPGNAPALALPQTPGLGLSISHSGRWVACAVSRSAALGLDIERVDSGRDVLALAGQAFGPAPAAQLAALEGAARVDAFYRMWCRHEAHIKLGSVAKHDLVHVLPGLALVLSSTQALDAAPVVVDMAGWVED